MKVKTSELTGVALDWAVGISIGQKMQCSTNGNYKVVARGPDWIGGFEPSTDWAQCGPLLNNLMSAMQWGITPFTDGTIMISNTNSDCLPYNGDWEQESINVFGDDILIATCRAIVTKELGEEVDIPDCLL